MRLLRNIMNFLDNESRITFERSKIRISSNTPVLLFTPKNNAYGLRYNTVYDSALIIVAAVAVGYTGAVVGQTNTARVR